jgi:hypothetical protein
LRPYAGWSSLGSLIKMAWTLQVPAGVWLLGYVEPATSIKCFFGAADIPAYRGLSDNAAPTIPMDFDLDWA